jgi:ATP-dependent DNA helicase RecG
MDDRLIEGSVLHQIDETMDFLQKHINVRFEITGKKAQRDTIWDYPLRALREAVTNAICHRDYARSSDIQIKVFDDTIRIWSPGVLAYDLSFEQLRKGDYSSRPRNKLIAQIFYDMEIIERYGSGIGRIDDACREAGIPPPEIENQGGGFTVIFSKAPAVTPTGKGAPQATPQATPQVTPQVRLLLQAVIGEMKRAEIMESLSLKDRTNFVRSYLEPALAQGLVEMTQPASPKSPTQKYHLTDRGRAWLQESQQ